jgi:hypothetical protein
MTTIKAYMQFPTRLADGTVILNDPDGPAFLKNNIISRVMPTTGALAGVEVTTKHTKAIPTRTIEIDYGQRALVPLVTAWALPELRDRVLVPGPVADRGRSGIIYKGLAHFKGGKNMMFGGKAANITFDPEGATEIVNLTPHAVTFKRGNMPDLTVESSGAARAEEVFSDEPVETVDGVPVYDLSYTGKIIGLPDQVPGRVYIVSMITAQALLALGIERSDVVSPNYVPALGGAPSVTFHI